MRDVDNGNSRLIHSNVVRFFGLVVQVLLSDDHVPEQDLHK